MDVGTFGTDFSATLAPKDHPTSIQRTTDISSGNRGALGTPMFFSDPSHELFDSPEFVAPPYEFVDPS